jgi:hypothetical protein
MRGHPEAFQNALDFAEHHYKAVPIHTVTAGKCSCGKPDCDKPGKHPRTPHGLDDATTDEIQLRRWNDRWPGSNWGVVAGDSASVIDIDSKSGGDHREVLDEYDLSERPIVWTGAAVDGDLEGVRGAHVYCAPGTPTAPKTAATGVEICGDRHYMLIPGSRHHSGHMYEWSNGVRPWTVELQPVPVALLLPEQSSNGHKKTAPPVEGVIPNHERNTTLASMAGTMRKRGFSVEAIAAALLIENRTRCKPPLPTGEVRTIARSIGRYAPTDDVTVGALSELNTLLGLDDVGKKIDEVKVFGEGTRATVWLEMDDGSHVALNPLSAYLTTPKLALEMAVTTGARPVLKAGDVMKAASLIHSIGHHHQSVEVEHRAAAIAEDYLRAAAIAEFDMADQGSRWKAFTYLNENPSTEVVLQDVKTGIRYVLMGRFSQFVRLMGGVSDSVLRDVLTVGWQKRGAEGQIKATQPKLKNTQRLRFFEVPAGWEDR